MRRTILVLATLSTEVLGRVAPRHVNEIPHPYWWEGPSTESLRENAYGLSSVPLPTSPPWREEPCEGGLKTTTPSSEHNTSLSTSTGHQESTRWSSDRYATTTTSPAFNSPTSHHIPTTGSQSLLIPTFIYSPLPSASLPAGNYSSPSNSASRTPLVPILGTSGYVVYPPYPTSIPTVYPTTISTTLGFSAVSSGAGSLNTSTQVVPVPLPKPSASASGSQAIPTSINVPTIFSSTVSPTAPGQESSVSSQTGSSHFAAPSSVSKDTTFLHLPTLVTVTFSVTSSSSRTILSSSATSAPLPTIVSNLSTPVSSAIATPASRSSSIQTTFSIVSTSTQDSSTKGLFSTPSPYSDHLSASRASISPTPSSSASAVSSITATGTSASISGLPSSTRSSAGTQGTGIPLAPSAAGASGGMTRGKEKVWWLSFLVPLLLTL
ncbi:hypothetical protein IAQ61_009206 [Plenodomus lingam]|uniref:Predicted protein n=1 Tax=Leptosphaeria maculans (strain JN3 / isolate v23.1.3 / race Av1-4-5-6-7-8) TaxID=985895 RepID=E4ZPY1_LEPMJ|nr:predicted protein [Plenodomus lingam JN3]KAH9865259.1 hypothetical protein IAQ61_009206 [Plenodomus lingam]CBX93516.1 predicted protein [Plenodomus lingam JN3]